MSGVSLWLSFVQGPEDGSAPRLRLGLEPGAAEIELTDRARWVLAAISLPRELAPETTAGEHQRARLGAHLWSSGEIIARIPYQHRSTIRLGLNDLRHRLRERDLVLEDYLLIDTDRGRYSLRTDRIAVDVVDLYGARHDPAALDRRLDALVGDRRRARLAAICAHLLAQDPRRELEQAIGASAARSSEPAPVHLPAPAQPPTRTSGPRRRGVLVRSLAALVAVAAVVASLLRHRRCLPSTRPDRRVAARVGVRRSQGRALLLTLPLPLPLTPAAQAAARLWRSAVIESSISAMSRAIRRATSSSGSL